MICRLDADHGDERQVRNASMVRPMAPAISARPGGMGEETLTAPALAQRDFMPLLGSTSRRTSEQTVHIGHTE
jgi:hypothetical protein